MHHPSFRFFSPNFPSLTQIMVSQIFFSLNGRRKSVAYNKRSIPLRTSNYSALTNWRLFGGISNNFLHKKVQEKNFFFKYLWKIKYNLGYNTRSFIKSLHKKNFKVISLSILAFAVENGPIRKSLFFRICPFICFIAFVPVNQ